jgi:hypothetical protein
MRGLLVLVAFFLMNCASIGAYAYAAQHEMPSVFETAMVAMAE